MDKLPFETLTREINIRKEATTNPAYGHTPEQRPIKEHISYGIAVINKPSGPTSHQVADYVSKILELPRAGNTGTLDPAVSGLLPVTLDKATRAGQTLLTAGKEYICLLKLHDDRPEDEIKTAVAAHLGTITQMPPVKSAVKRQ